MIYFTAAGFSYGDPREKADNSDIQNDLSDNVDEIIDTLDVSELEAYLLKLSEAQNALIGFGGIKNRIKRTYIDCIIYSITSFWKNLYF